VTKHWRLPANAESVAAARRLVREVALHNDAGQRLLDAIMLCVSEAVTNAVVHAYRDGSVGDLELETRRPNGFLCVYVRDGGVGMRRRHDSPGAGYGLPIITQLASEVTIRSRRDQAGTEVMMRFDLPEPVGER
jgi:anti-sigma regulatory factor (Ser/Thr protein kinase)